MLLNFQLRVYPVHMMNMARRQAAADPQTGPNDPGCESACTEVTLTIAIYYYYSAWKLILILTSRGGRRLSRPRHCSKGVPKALIRSWYDQRSRCHTSGGSTLGPGGHRPPKSCLAPPIFGHSSSATGWINWFYSKFRLVVVASQVIGARPPKYFFPEPPLWGTGSSPS